MTNQLAPVRVIRLASSSSISVSSHVSSCPSHPSRGGVTSHWAIGRGSLVIRTHCGSRVRVCVRLHIVAASVSTVLVGTARVCVCRGRRNRVKYSACILEEKYDVCVDDEKEKERNKWGMRLSLER